MCMNWNLWSVQNPSLTPRPLPQKKGEAWYTLFVHAQNYPRVLRKLHTPFCAVSMNIYFGIGCRFTILSACMYASYGQLQILHTCANSVYQALFLLSWEGPGDEANGTHASVLLKFESHIAHYYVRIHNRGWYWDHNWRSMGSPSSSTSTGWG